MEVKLTGLGVLRGSEEARLISGSLAGSLGRGCSHTDMGTQKEEGKQGVWP